MKLPEIAINNRQFTIVLFLLVLMIGVNSFLTMPRTEDPPITVPGAIIKVVYPGASPKDMEELVLKPMEEAINEIDDISKIKSTAVNNFAIIDVDFEYGSGDIDGQYDDVVNKINSIRKDLPLLIKTIDFDKKETSDVKILQLALTSETANFEVLRFEGERIEDLLEKINGIKKADIYALPEREIRVSIDISKMSKMNISIDDISNAIQSNNANIPGGDFNIGKKNFNIKTSGSYKTLNEIRNTVVGSYQGKLIYLKNIADVNFRYEDNNYIARYNGKRSIFIAAEQQIGVNIIKVIEVAQQKLETFKKELPEDISLNYVIDKSADVNNAIDGFLSNLIQGILIVSVLVMIAIGFRMSFVVVIAIPASILIGLSVLDFSGYAMQSISISGFVISLGLLVDNAIVVTENALRFMRQGYDSRTAAIKGTQQVGWPIVSSTITTLLAFLPIIMMTDAAGDYTISLPIGVIAVLLISLILALTVSPILIQVLFKKQTSEKKEIKKQPLQRVLFRFIEGPYKKLLSCMLKHPKKTLAFTILLFFASISIAQNFMKTSFFGAPEKAQFLIRINAEDGASIYKTNSIAHDVENMLDSIPDVKHYATNVGYGNPKAYNNLIVVENQKNFAEIFVELKKYNKSDYNKLVGDLRVKFDKYTQAEIIIKEFTQGVPSTYPVEVVIIGDKTDELLKISNDIEAIFTEQDGIINTENELKNTRTDIQVTVNKDKASLFGVVTSDIDRTIRAAMTGYEAGSFITDDGEEHKIIFSLPIDKQRNFNDFNNIYIESMLGKQIPLNQLAKIEFNKNQGKVTHYNTTRSATIGGDVAKGYNVATVTNSIKQKLLEYSFPKGYGFVIAGEFENQSSAFGALAKSALIAIIGIFLVLILQFKSIKQTFIVFAAIPLAFIGSILMLVLTGTPFSFMAFLGLVALMGIVINNSIILIDFTNKLREKGKTIKEAVLEAGQVRFTPIIITSLTTIFGLFPLTLQGSEMWTPLGMTIIGGLSLSTMLVLFIIPVLYLLFTKNEKIS
jgi:multidrug efflux pump subunit AcrB